MFKHNVYASHRGPYQLMVVREFATKKGFFRNQWLNGETSAEEVEEEALALLDDPRDPLIRAIHVWSVTENQFVMTYSRREAA